MSKQEIAIHLVQSYTNVWFESTKRQMVIGEDREMVDSCMRNLEKRVLEGQFSNNQIGYNQFTSELNVILKRVEYCRLKQSFWSRLRSD